MKKIAIITGASSGMGLEFTKELFTNYQNYKFLSNGESLDEIWILARRYDKLQDLKYQLEKEKSEFTENFKNQKSDEKIKKNKNSIEEKFFPEIRAIEIDLSGRKGSSSFAAILKAEKLAEKVTGGFEIALLINNAGFGTYGEFATTPLEKELDMINLNCTSLTGICGEALPFMAKNSTIINVASLAAFLPLGNFAVYAATKSYVLSFSVALAAELKDKKIHVMAMCPGSVSTEFANVASNGARKEVLHGKSAKKTVCHALKSASKKKYIALWAPKWKITAFFSRFIGRYFGARYTFKYNKRPSAF